MLAIRAARLFDGITARGAAMVLVDDGVVPGVDVSGADPPPRAEVVDLGTATLLPGLVDAHVHLALDASTDPVAHLAAADDDALLVSIRAAAHRALEAGVTTVRDLGDRGYLAVRLRDEVRADPRLGADVAAAGPPLTEPGGHCWFLGGEAAGCAGVRVAVRAHVVTWTLGSVPGPLPPPRIAALLTRLPDLVSASLDAGLRPLLASDWGVAPTKPHDALPHCVVAATRLGVDRGDALAAVTARAAAAVGLAGRKGRGAPGFDADLLAVDGDPLDDVTSLTRPVAVWHRGVRVAGRRDAGRAVPGPRAPGHPAPA